MKKKIFFYDTITNSDGHAESIDGDAVLKVQATERGTVYFDTESYVVELSKRGLARLIQFLKSHIEDVEQELVEWSEEIEG
jgi:hypothetical protein